MKRPRAGSTPTDRPFAPWPAWTCGAIDASSGRVCGARARYRQLPVAAAQIPWLYCEHHRPPGGEPIPADAAYSVTRLELKIALASAPGDPVGASEDAVRRLLYAVEAVGGVLVGLAVVGGEASEETLDGALGRLELAGRPEPLTDARSPFWDAPAGRRGPSWRRRKAG